MTGQVFSFAGWTGAASGNPTPDEFGSIWIVQDCPGWYEAPAPRTNSIPREQSDGDFDGKTTQPGRAFGPSGTVIATSRANLQRSMKWARALLVAGPRTADFIGQDDVLTLQANVRRDGETLLDPISDTAATFSFLLYSPDPSLYSAVLHEASTAPYAGANGRAYPRVYPMAYGPFGAQGLLTIHNDGDQDCYPLLTLTAGAVPAVNPQVQLLGGALIRAELTIAAHESLVIDLANETVELNGVASRFTSLSDDSEFFACPPGDSRLLFTVDSGSDAELDAQWRDTYA